MSSFQFFGMLWRICGYHFASLPSTSWYFLLLPSGGSGLNPGCVRKGIWCKTQPKRIEHYFVVAKLSILLQHANSVKIRTNYQWKLDHFCRTFIKCTNCVSDTAFKRKNLYPLGDLKTLSSCSSGFLEVLSLGGHYLASVC